LSDCGGTLLASNRRRMLAVMSGAPESGTGRVSESTFVVEAAAVKVVLLSTVLPDSILAK
jgi:hypothetical protein